MTLALSVREIEVLKQAANGLSVQQSAQESCHAEVTIKWHRSNAIRKTGAKNTTHAVALAIRAGLI